MMKMKAKAKIIKEIGLSRFLEIVVVGLLSFTCYVIVFSCFLHWMSHC